MTGEDGGSPTTKWKHLRRAVGWSLVFGLVVLVVAGVLGLGFAFAGAGTLGGAADWLVVLGWQQLLAQGLAALAGGLAATWVVGVRRFRMSLADLRWSRCGPIPRGLVAGLGLGVVPGLVVLLIPVLVSGGRWTVAGSLGEGLQAGGLTLLTLAPAALAEEVLFRGVPLVLMAAALGRGTGIMVVAVVFGLAHLPNPGATGIGIANVALAGVLLGTLFYGPGGLWAAFGAHLGWNITLALSGAAVSGLPFEAPLAYQAGGPVWLTGGAFGPEGGVLATGALTAAVMVAARWVRSSEP